MAQPDFTLGEAATSPILEEALDGPDGGPLDLSIGVENVKFIMAPWDGSVPAVTRIATISDAPNGVVQQTFLGADTDGHPGWWKYWWVVTYIDGQILPVPTTFEPAYRLLYVIPKLV